MIPPALMEQLAMYAAALPCPPIPVQLPTQEEPTTSHDLLVGLLIAAMTRSNRTLNEVRKATQMELTQTFLDAAMTAADTGAMYGHCKAFTAEYIHAFDDVNTCTPSVQFLNYDDVPMESKIHKAACSWNAAQDILFTCVNERHDARFYATMTYQQLIEWHRLRVQQQSDVVQFAPSSVEVLSEE